MSSDIGVCKLNSEGEIVELRREFYGQGMIFKSWDAYQNRPTDPCYVPEMSEAVYTAEDFFHLCNNQKEFADELFAACDWQHPESLLDEWKQSGEWEECPHCGYLIDCGNIFRGNKCLHCGREVDENDMEQMIFNIELEVVVTSENIDNIMRVALKGGIDYWCDKAEVVGDYLGESASEQISRGGQLKLYDCEEDEVYILTKEKLLEGVKLYCKKPIACNILEQMDGKMRLNCCYVDAYVCNAIIQYALFGNVIYG